MQSVFVFSLILKNILIVDLSSLPFAFPEYTIYLSRTLCSAQSLYSYSIFWRN